METPSRKKARVDLTSGQQHLLTIAAGCRYVTIDANDPFALVLLKAAKMNSRCTRLWVEITMKETIPKEFLNALAHFVVAHPYIEHLAFFGDTYSNSVRADEAGDDYTALIAAMVGSQSLQRIVVEQCLPLKLEEAIIEVFRRKSTSISLELDTSMIFVVHPIAFGEMLATTKCLSQLILDGAKVVGDQPCDRSHFRDGLQKNQSLQQIEFLSDCEPGMLNDVLECTEGIESLTVWSRLNSTTNLFLSKFVSKHKKLAFLNVSLTPDALCEAVSCSQSLTELVIGCCSNVSAISRMLQQTTSLQKLRLDDGKNFNFETLAVGLEACKTLVRLETPDVNLNVKEAHALLQVVLTNHNFSEITIGGVAYHRLVCPPEENATANLQMELSFYLSFNKQGRALPREDVPSGVWQYALKKAGSSSLPDALYYFLQEMPELIKYHSSVH